LSGKNFDACLSVWEKMAKAKKTRKFGATKRLLNATKDTRIQSAKTKGDKVVAQKDGKNELVREMYPFL
jgi:hypothetical protein